MSFQSSSSQLRVGVVIVVAEHRPNASRSTQSRECFGARFDVPAICGRVVAGKHKKIGFCLLGQTHHSLYFFDTKDLTEMDIGQLRDTKIFKTTREVFDENVRL